MLIKMKESKGFTLVELMIVVAIIGILAAVAVPYYQRYVAKSRLTSLVFPAVHAIENAISTRYAVQGDLPASIESTEITGGVVPIASTNMMAISNDASLTYITNLQWTKDSTGGDLVVEIDPNAVQFAQLSAHTLTARANADGPVGTLYWTYSGKLAKDLGF